MQGIIRTPKQEELLQTGTPEQNAWHYVIDRHRAQERYAHGCAKAILDILDTNARKHGIILAMHLMKDDTIIDAWIEIYKVTKEHRELCKELVRKSFEARYPLG